MTFGQSPGEYRPSAATGREVATQPATRRVNPDGTVTTLGPAVTPTATTQHSNASRLAQWRAEMDAAQAEQASEIGDVFSSRHDASRTNMEHLWRQLGLDPSAVQTAPTQPAQASTTPEVQQAIQDWLKRRDKSDAGTPNVSAGSAGTPAPVAAGALSNDLQSMRDRAARMRALSRAWNAY